MKKGNVKTKIGFMIFVLLVFCFAQAFADPCGDVNSDGSIDIVDGLLVAQYYVGLNPSNFDSTAADVNGDGSIDIVDALLIAQYYVGLITSLPGCETVSEVTYELQAETTSTWDSATVDSDNTGYTGSGFVNTENISGTWIEWSLDATQACTAVCVFTYSNGGTEDRPMDVSVNGSYVTALSFPITTDWTTWSTQTAEMSLGAGTNTIRLTATTDNGAPNLDKMDITIQGGDVVVITPAPTQEPTPSPDPQDDSVPNGYAEGTTGGGSASQVTVSSASDFAAAVGGTGSGVIIVNGRIDMGGNITIGSNKTVKGANSSSGLYGGAVLIQGTNCIIQNLTLGPNTDGDVLEVSEATYIFIHKCAFYDSTDELCSIVRASDYVTVSWCRFYFDNPDDHAYAHLIGNGDDYTDDAGKLHVTLHHNWYDYSVNGRMPRVRYGYVHIYNNYYNSTGNDYCIGTGYQCHIRVENTHFDNINNPWKDFGATTSDGVIGWDGLLLEGCSEPTFISNSYPVFSLPYSYTLDSVNDVESLVRAGAGNVF